jgi:TPR repeat protein
MHRLALAILLVLVAVPAVPQDRAQAAAWYRKSAEQGDPRAQFNLGLMYRYGPGYSPSLDRWVETFEPAPGYARPTAQSNPAAKYNSGSGIPKDYIEAHKWMSLAAARATGDNQRRFADARDSLAKVMTPDQIAEAQKRASEWTVAFEKRKESRTRPPLRSPQVVPDAAAAAVLVQVAAFDQRAEVLLERVAAGAGQPDGLADGNATMLAGEFDDLQ